MKRNFKTFLCMIIVLSIVFTANVHASTTYIKKASKVSGNNFTSSDILASKLDKIFKGKAGICSGGNTVKVPLGCKKLNAYNMYCVKDKTTGDVIAGWQCYIYANGVYNTLFGECIGHGNKLLHSQKVISGGAKKISYKKLKKAGVKCGAYLRTTSNSSGKYSKEYGHSLIILSYNSSTITYLDANGDNAGSVYINTQTWNEFNRKHLTRLSRRICFVIQPTDSYYNDLYGTDIKLSAKDKGKDYSPKLTKKSSASYKTTIYKGQTIKLKISGTKSKVKWTTSNKSIATVSKNGKVVAKKNGSVTITAVLVDKKIKCKIKVKAPYLNNEKISLKEGDSNGLKMIGSAAKTWTSSNKAVAIVDSKGKVTALKQGNALITVKAKNGKTYKCKVTVTPEHNSIKDKLEETENPEKNEEQTNNEMQKRD